MNFAGVDIANLANNHTLNYGREGLVSTSNILRDMGISSVGFDFFSKDPKEEDFDLIKGSNKKVDILLVGVHWSVEYTINPLFFRGSELKRLLMQEKRLEKV